MSSGREISLPKSLESTLDRPFDGLFGDTAELRVLQEIVADPYSDYTQQDLMDLTGLSDPSVRKGIQALIRHGIVKNASSIRRRPIYRANLESKKLTALTFLAYASLDEKAGSTSMEEAIRHYCDSISLGVEVVPLADDSTYVRHERPLYERAASDEGRFKVIIQEA